jgi:[ribosomal protein S5]-alanine N-acetyltransferase
MEILTGPTITLRTLTLSDATSIFALFSDPEAMRYWCYPPLTELSQAEERLKRDRDAAAAQQWFTWAMTLDEKHIGTVTLHDINREQGRAEIGYMLGRNYWGRGLAREAATLVIDHAFGPLGLRRLEADIDPRNVASEKLLLRLGFQKEGYLRERWQVGSEISDTSLFGLLKRDWEARCR